MGELRTLLEMVEKEWKGKLIESNSKYKSHLMLSQTIIDCIDIEIARQLASDIDSVIFNKPVAELIKARMELKDQCHIKEHEAAEKAIAPRTTQGGIYNDATKTEAKAKRKARGRRKKVEK